jgi:tetratricopeptide (TPR) repeat protein
VGKRLRAILWILALPLATVRAQNRPLVIIFPIAPASQKVLAPAPAGVEVIDPQQLAGRALREAFLSENLVDSLVYAPDQPVFRRALADGKIALPAGVEPDEALRARIASACGAAWMVSITSLIAAESPTKTTALQLQAVGLKGPEATRRRWSETIPLDDSGRTLVPKTGAIPDSLRSAARVAVLHFQGSAFKELRAATVRPELLPQPAAPRVEAVDDAAALGENGRADALRQTGETLIREGEVDAGLRSLRRAIHLSPRSSALRAALIQAYLGQDNTERASDELRRALLVVAADDPGRRDLLRLQAQAIQAKGDPAEARLAYEKALEADPKNVATRLALADLLLSQGDTKGAQQHYAAVRSAAPTNRDALRGLAQLRAAQGDFDGALQEMAADPAARHDFATALFLETAMRVATRMVQNRSAWEEGKLSRESFYTATEAQTSRVNALPRLLMAAPPAPDASDAVKAAHKHRTYAASLLAQSLLQLQSFLETTDASAGAQARVFLDEFFIEIKEAASPSAAPKS